MTFDKNRLLTKWFLLCANILSRRSRADLLRSGTTLCSFTWIAIIIPGAVAAFALFFIVSFSVKGVGIFLGVVAIMLAFFGAVGGSAFGIMWLACRSYKKQGVFFVLAEYAKAVKGKVCPLIKFK